MLVRKGKCCHIKLWIIIRVVRLARVQYYLHTSFCGLYTMTPDRKKYSLQKDIYFHGDRPKKEFLLVLCQFPTRSFITCYLPKCIILTVILFRSNMNRSYSFIRSMVLLHCHVCQTWQRVAAMPDVASWCCCVATSARHHLARHWLAVLCLHIT